jgi:hypothetical protein
LFLGQSAHVLLHGIGYGCVDLGSIYFRCEAEQEVEHDRTKSKAYAMKAHCNLLIYLCNKMMTWLLENVGHVESEGETIQIPSRSMRVVPFRALL